MFDGKYLKKLRADNHYTQSKLALLLGVSRSTISMWEIGSSEPDNEALTKIAELFNVSIDSLLGRKFDNNIEPISLPKNVIKIPVLGRIPAGVPLEAIEDVLEYVEISEELTRGGKEFFALKIQGDSMYPEYLSGDIVIFEVSPTCETGDDCAVMVNGDDATFKRIERKENGIMVKPLNPEYETTFFTNEEIETKPVRILGIARELRRRK